MNFHAWRTANGLSLGEAAIVIGKVTRGTLHKIENGRIWVGAGTAELIYWATKAVGPEPVTLANHLGIWRKAHDDELKHCQKEGLAARRRFKKLRSKENTNGKVKKGQRREEAGASEEG